ncbi:MULTISPECIES: ATP-binding protein [Coprobacillaceae]|uniref:ATP-binding protein n=1 Tax=Coprobacillaceae TaxID=2810280 RepID=UPI001C8B5D3A|nr:MULTISPECIES: ATP-binding protein [Coprobacillaceae]MBX9164551.1 ATP-binding protein [Coprobacillus sp. K06]MEE0490849.1 ATP-binding protein [Catenibacterium sp.]
MEIRRDLYLNKLIKRKNNGLIKVVTGIRRCGKSYLLNNLFYNHLIESGVAADHIIRFAFDSADDLYLIGESLIQIEKEKRGVDPEKFMAYIRSQIVDNGMYYLLLDEIQLLDCFETVLNGYLRKDNMDVFVTGSNAKLLSKDIITQFAGRGDEVHMYPLSFAEFMTIYKGDKYAGLEEYMLYGGIPIVVLREDANEKASILENLFTEIYLRDITQRNRVKNIGELEDLLNILSSSIGSLTNPEKLKNTFKSVKKSKITSQTIKKYIDYFEDSFLIESALRYDIKGKSYIETPKKYYFSDLGLRNARINFRQFEPTHSMENVIYNELRMRGYNVDVGVVATTEKNQEGKIVRKQLEVDFVCNLGSSRYYIQSAYSLPDETKRTQEIRPFRKIDDSFKKIVITKDFVHPYYDDYGILTVNIYDFLLDPEIIHR